tara:strand:+ start:1618 stop:1836 length:219 start_codon:yes stop_codon:yes gene_type:complete
MVIENHPGLSELSVADKLLLSEELCADALLTVEAKPELARLVKERLDDYRSAPDTGVSWEELKARILGTSDA